MKSDREIIVELLQALEEMTEAYEGVVGSEFKTPGNRKPWEKHDDWQQANKLITQYADRYRSAK